MQHQINEQFAGLCFLHLPDGQLKRVILVRLLRSDAWVQAQVHDSELSHYGMRHGSKDHECGFCATHYTSANSAIACIRLHVLL